jgi:hypothetical protein
LKTFTNTEASSWVRSVGLEADEHLRVWLPNNSGYIFTVRWPKLLPYQVPHFANLFLPDNDGDCLFLLTDNGTSGAMEFEIACRSLKLLRSAHGEHRGILESPAYLLQRDEIADARLLVTMAILFCWDAYIVPAHGRYFLWIDDDEAADVCCKNKQDYEHLLSRFRDWGLVPEVAPSADARA